MIFITVGTHDQEFTRLVKRIDKIAPKINEEIIIQRGFTKYVPKNCKSFRFEPSLEKYYKKARLVIIHGASSVWEFAYNYKKPLIIVPRQYKFNEHINDHQVDFAKSFSQKTGIRYILDIEGITSGLLKKYKKKARIKDTNLKKIQNFMKKVILEVEPKDK
jgi:UDP-N-acetylglucosamine transferase subunit ALG13